MPRLNNFSRSPYASSCPSRRAGGGTDIPVRLIQDKYAPRLCQPIIVEDRPGASADIGAAAVAKSKPGGYTLIVQATIIGVYPSVFPDLGYDPLTDLAYVGGVAESPAAIVVNRNSKLKTIGDPIAEAKARPKQVNFASDGAGSPHPCPIKGLRDGDHRSDIRRARLRRTQPQFGAAADSGRQAAYARRCQRNAQQDSARCADREESGLRRRFRDRAFHRRRAHRHA